MSNKNDNAKTKEELIEEIIALRAALERSPQLEQMRLAALGADIGSALTMNITLTDMLNACANALVTHLDAAFARIWTFNAAENVLELQASAGMYTHINGPHSRVPLGKLKIGLIAAERQPHLTNNVKEDPRVGDPAWAKREGMVAFAGYPLVVADQLVGVMAVFARTTLTELTLEAMASVARVISLGIERQHIYEQIQEQREQYAVTLSSIGDAVIATDTKGHITFLNSMAQKLTGWPVHEAIGHEISEVFHIVGEETRQSVENPALKAIREGTIVGLANHTILITRDGIERAIDDSGAPIYGSQGKIIGAVLTFRDITLRRDSEKNLNIQTETLKAINEFGKLLAAELNMDKLVQEVTDVATELTRAQFGAFFYNVVDEKGESYTLYTISGVDRAAFEGFPMPRNTAIFGPTFRGEGVVRLDDVKKDPRYGKNSPFNGMPSGHLPVTSYLAVPVLSRSGDVIGGLFGHEKPGVFTAQVEDIVVGLASQAAIAMDNARLFQEAQKAIQVRDQFLSIASHELRTPITALLGHTQLLQRRMLKDNNPSERELRTLNMIVEQARRLDRLTYSLLDLARIQTGKFSVEQKPVDIVSLLQHVIEENRLTIDRHTIGYTGPAESLTVEGDDLRLGQVFYNLIQNAIKYSPDGGEITIIMNHHAGEIEVSISDKGIGIPKQALPFLFSRFFRAQNIDGQNIPGMGIGLYVVKEIISAHNGTIEVRSSEGVGSTFIIRLPLNQS